MYVLVLGGGNDQKPLIETIAKTNFKSIVVDYNPDCEGKKIADVFLNISNRNAAKIVEKLNNLKIAQKVVSVFVMGTDIPHIAVSICKQIGIDYWLDENSAQVATNKHLMKKFLNEFNIPTPKQFTADSITELVNILSDNSGAMVLKPQDCAGSRGVFLIKGNKINPNKINKLFKETLSFNDGKSVLVEEYIHGEQLSVEALVVDTKINIFGFALRNYEMNEVFAPQIIENGGIQPYPPLFSKLQEVEKIIQKIFQKLSLSRGVIKLDLVVNSKTEKVMVIEFALRLSGGNFSSDIIPRSLGQDFLAEYMNMALKKPVNKSNLLQYEKIYANRYFFREGSITENFEALALPVEDIKNLKSIGNVIHKIRTHADRAGYFLTSGSSLAEVNKNIALVYKKYKRYRNVNSGSLLEP